MGSQMKSNNVVDVHVVMFPFSAFGHMIPFYQLSIALAKKGVQVSYISTPKNIARLPTIPSNLSPFMQFVSLPLPQLPNSKLPLGAEATVDIESDETSYLQEAYDLLCEPFKQFVSTHSPNWIISDFAAYWMPNLAHQCKVKLMFFTPFTASASTFVGPPEYLVVEGVLRVRPTPECLTKPPPWVSTKIPSSSIALRGFEAPGFHYGLYFHKTCGVTTAERIAAMIQGSQVVCIRSCQEFEQNHIDLYQSIIHKPVIPAGLLPPEEVAQVEDGNGQWSKAFNWLDQQKVRSVIYVGFGSEYKLTKTEVYEIAYGLELAELPFIWALRKPTWAANEFEALPPEFTSRTSGKGMVCIGWVPQLKILAHKSIGGSLFHSGWGSIVETLQHGHNLIVLPFTRDQGLNARMIVEKGLGIEVERKEDGSFTRDDIAYALRKAMIGDEAEKIFERTKHIATIFGDKRLHDGYICELVKCLQNGITT